MNILYRIREEFRASKLPLALIQAMTCKAGSKAVIQKLWLVPGSAQNTFKVSTGVENLMPPQKLVRV